MSVQYNAIITEEGGGFVALNPEMDVASQGDTIQEALKNLREAVELYLEETAQGAAKRRPLKSQSSFSTTSDTSAWVGILSSNGVDPIVYQKRVRKDKIYQ